MSEAKATISTGTRLSPVWILPVAALLLGVWAVIYNINQQGPEIQIRFETAKGLVEGQTKLKYREVEIGVVQNIRFSSDRASVIVTANLDLGSEDLLRDDSRFWLVTALFPLGMGVSSLARRSPRDRRNPS